MRLVTSDGKFSLPLYHGTSSFFADMIMQDGLGTINIVDSWRLLDMAREIVLLIKENEIIGQNDPDAILNFDMLERMAEQGITTGGFNFRHGTVYLSAARSDALRYASNPKGSEFLTMLSWSLDLLRSSKSSAMTMFSDNYPEAVRAIESDHHPVIIVVHDVMASALQTEAGEDLMQIVDAVESMVDGSGEIPDYCLQLLRFELIGSLPRTQLEVEAV